MHAFKIFENSERSIWVLILKIISMLHSFTSIIILLIILFSSEEVFLYNSLESLPHEQHSNPLILFSMCMLDIQDKKRRQFVTILYIFILLHVVFIVQTTDVSPQTRRMRISTNLKRHPYLSLPCSLFVSKMSKSREEVIFFILTI